MNHIVLLGDSIFDNAAYVHGNPDVITHLNSILPKDWKATLLAVDGAISTTSAGKSAIFLNRLRIWSSVLVETMGFPGQISSNDQHPQWLQRSNN